MSLNSDQIAPPLEWRAGTIFKLADMFTLTSDFFCSSNVEHQNCRHHHFSANENSLYLCLCCFQNSHYFGFWLSKTPKSAFFQNSEDSESPKEYALIEDSYTQDSAIVVNSDNEPDDLLDI